MTIARSRGCRAARHDRRPARVVHVEAVDHHRGLDPTRRRAAPEPQHLRHVRVAEEQPPGQLVVLLVERAAGDEDAYRCIMSCQCLGAWVPGAQCPGASAKCQVPGAGLRTDKNCIPHILCERATGVPLGPGRLPGNSRRRRRLVARAGLRRRIGIDVASCRSPGGDTHVRNFLDSHWRGWHLLRAAPQRAQEAARLNALGRPSSVGAGQITCSTILDEGHVLARARSSADDSTIRRSRSG